MRERERQSFGAEGLSLSENREQREGLCHAVVWSDPTVKDDIRPTSAS